MKDISVVIVNRQFNKLIGLYYVKNRLLPVNLGSEGRIGTAITRRGATSGLWSQNNALSLTKGSYADRRCGLACYLLMIDTIGVNIIVLLFDKSP
jgi:hypothetical protein